MHKIEDTPLYVLEGNTTMLKQAQVQYSLKTGIFIKASLAFDFRHSNLKKSI
jgi:hypothetical protein